MCVARTTRVDFLTSPHYSVTILLYRKETIESMELNNIFDMKLKLQENIERNCILIAKAFTGL